MSASAAKPSGSPPVRHKLRQQVALSLPSSNKNERLLPLVSFHALLFCELLCRAGNHCPLVHRPLEPVVEADVAATAVNQQHQQWFAPRRQLPSRSSVCQRASSQSRLHRPSSRANPRPKIQVKYHIADPLRSVELMAVAFDAGTVELAAHHPIDPAGVAQVDRHQHQHEAEHNGQGLVTGGAVPQGQAADCIK